MDLNARRNVTDRSDGSGRELDTKLVQDLIDDMADVAARVAEASEGLALERAELSGLDVLDTRLAAVEEATHDLGGPEGLLVRVNALEGRWRDRKEGNASNIALVAVLISLAGVLVDLLLRLVP